MKLRRKILLCAAVFIALGLFLPVLQRHRAIAALEAYRKQLVAQGEKLGVGEVAPRISADEQASARALMDTIGLSGSSPTNYSTWMKVLSPGHALISWKENTLPDKDSTNIWPSLQAQISARTQWLNAVRTMLKEPVGELNLDYNQGLELLLPHLAKVKQAALWLAIAAKLELHEGHPAEACEDLKACLALNSLLEREPIMISQLVRIAFLQITLGAAWEALQAPALQDAPLAALQVKWESLDSWVGAAGSLEMERNDTPLTFKALRERDPAITAMLNGGHSRGAMMGFVEDAAGNSHRGLQGGLEALNGYLSFWAWKWQGSYKEELYNLQLLQTALQTARKLQQGGDPSACLLEYDANASNLLKLHEAASKGFLLGVNNDLFHNYLRKLILMEAERRLLVTAIALKRFQLAHGKYPDQLSELVPGFLNNIPLDAMDGNPLRYHLQPGGKFLLYSVGEDGEDNGGDPTPTNTVASATINWNMCRDMVWPMPATPAEVDAYKKKMSEEWNQKHPVVKAR